MSEKITRKMDNPGEAVGDGGLGSFGQTKMMHAQSQAGWDARS